jgi:hypothetical protein
MSSLLFQYRFLDRPTWGLRIGGGLAVVGRGDLWQDAENTTDVAGVFSATFDADISKRIGLRADAEYYYKFKPSVTTDIGAIDFDSKAQFDLAFSGGVVVHLGSR